MQVYAFASGSSGNAVAIQGSNGTVLVDAGIPQRTLLQRLQQARIAPADIRGIVVTHEHGDHTTSVVGLAKRLHVPVMATAGTLANMQIPATVDTIVLQAQQPVHLADIEFIPIAVKHDAAEPIALTARQHEIAATIATDLGSWDETLLHAARESQLVVIEANHERERLYASRYDQALKLRIASPYGHLDNIQAGEFLARLCQSGPSRDVWLAHLSHEANTPQLATKSIQTVLQMHQVTHQVRTITALPRLGTVYWGAQHRSQQQTLW